MSTYRAFLNSKSVEIEATSLYAAKLKAIEVLKPRKAQMGLLAVVLVERTDGTSVSVPTDF